MKKIIFMVLFVLMAFSLFADVTVETLPFNSKDSERMPYFFENTLYYVNYKYDIYQVKMDGEEWGKPKKVEGEINTDFNEVNPCVIRKDGKLIMYFARYQDSTDFDIFRSEYNDKFNMWMNTTKVEELSSDLQEWSIAVNSNETLALFTSKGNFDGNSKGARDIWISENKNGKWSNPKNLSDVNSTGSEWDVSLVNKDVYFSSAAFEDSLGGYDLYKYNLDSKKIIHLEKDINSSKDERGMWTDGKNIIFTSKSRVNGAGSYDLFKANLKSENSDNGFNILDKVDLGLIGFVSVTVYIFTKAILGL